MYARNWEDFAEVDASGRLVRTTASSLVDSLVSVDVNAPVSTIDDEPNFGLIPQDGGVSGVVDAPGDTDFYTVNLVAGQTYTFSLQGAGLSPITDAFLLLYNPNGTFNMADDDGGNGLSSIITYTAAETGTYYLRASSFANAGDPGLGTYQLDVRQMGSDSVGVTNATSGNLNVGGYVIGFLETGTDVDRYAVTLEAGQYYTFRVAGGADYETDYLNVPTGELDTILTLRDANGNALASGDDNNFPTDISSGLGFYAEVSGTYYLDVDAYAGQTGGYVLASDAPVNPLDFDPLEALRWDSAANIDTVDVNGTPTAYVYFGAAGETFGETLPQGTMGWTAAQQAAVMNVLQNEYTPITGIQYLVTTDVTQAEFRLLTVPTATYGARFYPQDPAYGTQEGIGTFNLASGGFGAFPQSLVEGGFSYAVIMHEFGHAHGIAHPHDHGGGSEIMLGVTGATGSLGVFDLNQGVYTVMSYNDAWVRHPDSPSQLFINTIDRGWSASLSAFDIAVLQERYGVHEHNGGNDVYALTDIVADAAYQTIWDSGGTDAIAYSGALDAHIDLTAATLDYSPTGGGVVSFLYNDPDTVATTHPALLLHGGYTIANGVVIENATGGSGNDVLIGNSANNVLTGNDGNDNLLGRDGNDILRGGAGADKITGGDGLDVVTLGAGNDTFIAEVGATEIALKTGTMSVDIITDFDSAGNDQIDLSGIDQDFNFRWTDANKNDGDLTYKVYTSVNGAEKALGFDIDGQPGASGVSGPVTVVYGNVDGGTPDFAIVLLGTAHVGADDFIFA